MATISITAAAAAAAVTTTTTTTAATTTTYMTSTSSLVTTTDTTVAMERRKSYHELCRLCASYDAVRMDIFGQEGKNRQLIDKIQICLPFKIVEDDRLPKVLCYRCMYNLENFYDFRTACVNANAWLERNRPKEDVNDDADDAQCDEMRTKHLRENMPVLIPEAPVVNPNAALGTPPRLNSDGEADPEIEEIIDTSEGADEVIDDSEDRRSEYEYEMDMETNPSDFLEMTPMVTEENEEDCGANNTSGSSGGGGVAAVQETAVLPHASSQQHEVYVCSLCNKAFSSKGHLSLHARIHAGEGDVIGERVITDDHTSFKRPYQCDLCHKSYSTAKHRWGHVSTSHRGHPAVTCAYCSRIYSTRYNLDEHIKSRHAGLPPNPELSVTFPRVQTANENGSYQCQTCAMVFADFAVFNAHRQICMEEQQRADLMDQRAEARANKNVVYVSDASSADSDDENKDFKSAEAKLAKNPQLTILKHALTKGESLKRNHDDASSAASKPRKITKTDDSDINSQKRWYCEVCPQNFTSTDGLKEHVESMHEVEKRRRPFICILCKKDFGHKTTLKQHIMYTHGVDPTPIINSNKCLNTMEWNSGQTDGLYEQIETKEEPNSSSPEITIETDDKDSKADPENESVEIETVFICELCARDFNDRASLWLHIRATHKEIAGFACGVCLKICNDNIQLQNHLNMYHAASNVFLSIQRRYSCTICGRQHDSRKKLIAHVSIHNLDPMYDPAHFVRLNSIYCNDNLNGNEGNEQDFDGDDGEKVDCYICYKSFPNEDHLIRHQRNAHKSEQIVPLGDGNAQSVNGNSNRAQYHLFFVCEVCGSSHSSKWDRWLHIDSKHRDESSIKCEYENCEMLFATKSLRNDHIQHHVIQGPIPNTCEVCGKLWPTRVDYWKHMMGVHTATVPFICGVCLKVVANVLKLQAHVRAKHWPLTNGDFSCDICGRPYSNKSKMSRHRKIHGLEAALAAAAAAAATGVGDGGDVAPCDNGGFNDDAAAAANQSMIKLEQNNGVAAATVAVAAAAAAAELELNCEQCPDLSFPSLESLCNHRRLVHGLFPCDLCVKYYGRTSHLWKHVNRVHKGHADVTCPYCSKTSASRDHLAAHIAKNHRYVPAIGKDPGQNCVAAKSLQNVVEDGVLHYCEKCNKGFHKRYLLRRHMKGCQNYRKDPGALLTRCRACERIFKDRASLQKHIENHHSTYTCHLCDETITSKLGIMTHNRVNHMDHPDLTCAQPSCKKLFRTKEDLESHRKDHKYHSSPNVCDFCGDTVENKLKLKMHVLSLHRNEIGVSCGVCLIPMKDPKDLKKHVETEHSGVLTRPNTCQVCGKQYASKWKAFDHTKKCHGKVFLTCKQCLAVFTDENDIRDHYEYVHNVSKDQLSVFEYKMDMGVMMAKREGRETPDVVVKEEPDDLEPDEELCDGESSSESSRKRKRNPNDTHDCEMCPEIFLNQDTLAKHYQNVHNTDPVRMFKKFRKDNVGDKRKRNRSNFECKNCKRQFPTKTLFWNHIGGCGPRNSTRRYADFANNAPTSILESHLKNNNQIPREELMPLTNESNLNIPDFNLFEDINMQLSAQKPVPNLMPLSQMKPGNAGKCSRKDSRKVYDESTNTTCTCEVCGKQWPAKKHLWQHLIRFHRAEAAVTCGVCLKLCKSYEDLSDHLKAEHAPVLSPEGNNFTCKTCGRYHNARSKLLLHMSIHIGNFRCEKCQRAFASEDKLGEHAIVGCNGRSECGEEEEDQEEEAAADEDNGKNDNDEKGSLIADETSAIEEVEEEAEEDFESEGVESRDVNDEEDSNSDEGNNSENSDSDSASSSSSDDEDEEKEEQEVEEVEEQEEEEEEEEEEAEEVEEVEGGEGDEDNENESGTRTTSRASDNSVSCSSESEDSDEEAEVRTVQKEVARASNNTFEIRDGIRENSTNEDRKTDHLAARTADAKRTKPSGNDLSAASGGPADRFEAPRREKSAKAATSDADLSDEDDKEEENNENDEEDEGDEGEGEDEAEAESEDGTEGEEEKEREEEQEEDDDDGPPVLSPIMPLCQENESEEHGNADRTRHKLSPMVSLGTAHKDLEECEMAVRSGASGNADPPASNVMQPSAFYAATNNNNEMSQCQWVSDSDENGVDSDIEDDKDVMVVNDQQFGKAYEKMEIDEVIDENFEEDSMDENDDREDAGADEQHQQQEQQQQVHEIHNIDGTVLMVANDADGNQILIEQNVLDIGNEDSNAEMTQYIYPENTYEIVEEEEEEEEEEEDYETRNEAEDMQTDEMGDGVAYVQNPTSENEDSMEMGDVEENSDDMQK